MAENPNTWGPAERAVEQVLRDFYANQDKPITDPSKTVFGPTLEAQIVAALREAGQLKDTFQSDGPDAAFAFAALEAILTGRWDRYLLRLRGAIEQRRQTDEYAAQLVAGR